jgi:diaminobutyrate-2-oxoglutarate transaminase
MHLDFSFRRLGRPFLILWVGITVSLVGNLLASFALNVWVFQHSGSVLAYSGMVVATTMPALLILPWAGSFADSMDRRYVLIISCSFSVIFSLALAALLWCDRLVIWHLYVYNVLVATVSAFERPAYQATVSSLLSKEQLTRGVGLMGLSSNLLATFSPVAAGVLLGVIGLPGIILIEIVMACIATVLVVKAITCMSPIKTALDSKQYLSIRGILRNFGESMSFFKKQRLLMGLLAYVVILNGLIALVSTLFTPLVLSNHTESELGVIMSIAGIGSLMGSGFLFVTENLKRLMKIVLICDAILSICIMVGGSGNSLVLYSSCGFIAMLAGAVGGGCSTSLWMRKLPLERQGSIFALVGTIALIIVSVITVVGGYVADHVFEPALSSGGIWADSIGVWLGAGKGSGLSLVFILCGFMGAMLSLSALTQRRFRNMESFIPDGR